MSKGKWLGLVPYYLLVAILCIGGAVYGSNAVTASVQDTPVTRSHTIVIDAGHGGIDGGATSCTGVLESNINLEIALKLDDFLRFLGFDTVMIRKTDTSVYTDGKTIASQKVSDLKERVRIVNNTENAVLVSIHQNTFSDGKYDGAQVFYANTDGSRSLAEKLQTLFCKTVNPGSHRKCKSADSVYLLQNINCAGVLVECGFLSNPTEEAKLRDSNYQNQLCCVIGSALSEFFAENS